MPVTVQACRSTAPTLLWMVALPPGSACRGRVLRHQSDVPVDLSVSLDGALVLNPSSSTTTTMSPFWSRSYSRRTNTQSPAKIPTPVAYARLSGHLSHFAVAAGLGRPGQPLNGSRCDSSKRPILRPVLRVFRHCAVGAAIHTVPRAVPGAPAGAQSGRMFTPLPGPTSARQLGPRQAASGDA
jgi:hypothetical protein